MEDIIIRLATLEDTPKMWDLIHELAVYERAPEELVLTREQLAEDFKNDRYIAFLAYKGDQLVGMALGYYMYSTWKGLSVYLEDLVVNESFRRLGIGSRLFEQFVRFAKEKKAGKLVWQVLDWNTPAIEFYKKYEAEFLHEWLTCKLTGEQIGEFGDLGI
jgi:ribosomal protein S18 acetylase RimI-like enzyme